MENGGTPFAATGDELGGMDLNELLGEQVLAEELQKDGALLDWN